MFSAISFRFEKSNIKNELVKEFLYCRKTAGLGLSIYSYSDLRAVLHYVSTVIRSYLLTAHAMSARRCRSQGSRTNPKVLNSFSPNAVHLILSNYRRVTLLAHGLHHTLLSNCYLLQLHIRIRFLKDRAAVSMSRPRRLQIPSYLERGVLEVHAKLVRLLVIVPLTFNELLSDLGRIRFVRALLILGQLVSQFPNVCFQ